MIIIYNLSHVREGEGKVEREDISLLTDVVRIYLPMFA